MRTILLLLALAPAASACAIPWRLGQSVRVASEDALIVWDAATQTEHFVRRANFQTQAPDFGFLVPTPTKPELAEADDAIFDLLAAATAPKVVYRHRVERVYRTTEPFAVGAAAPAPKAAVEVLDRKKVAGYDAVVLKANDPEALRDWLDTHGYDARPELVEWFRWYTDHDWLLTAFKLSKDGSTANALTGRTVRMTFRTDAPFYPYREPADMRKDAGGGNRLLRVYFLGDRRFEGTLGQDGTWPGKAVWSNPSPDATTRAVVAGLGLEPAARDAAVARPWRLTEFEDESSPRPGTDEVYFRPAASQDPLEKPPVVVPVTVYEYVDLPVRGPTGAVVIGLIAATVGLIGFIAWRLLRK